MLAPRTGALQDHPSGGGITVHADKASVIARLRSGIEVLAPLREQGVRHKQSDLVCLAQGEVSVCRLPRDRELEHAPPVPVARLDGRRQRDHIHRAVPAPPCRRSPSTAAPQRNAGPGPRSRGSASGGTKSAHRGGLRPRDGAACTSALAAAPRHLHAGRQGQPLPPSTPPRSGSRHPPDPAQCTLPRSPRPPSPGVSASPPPIRGMDAVLRSIGRITLRWDGITLGVPLGAPPWGSRGTTMVDRGRAGPRRPSPTQATTRLDSAGRVGVPQRRGVA